MSVLSYVHLLAAVLYLGAMLFVGALLAPVARRLREEPGAGEALAHVVAVAHPVALGALGLLIIGGAAMLTDLKVALGQRYFTELFATLAPKLLVVFIAALLNSYQFFGVGLRLTRAAAGADGDRPPADSERPAAVLAAAARLQSCAWGGAILGGLAIYLGLVMRGGG
jgi:hypothetical protein